MHRVEVGAKPRFNPHKYPCHPEENCRDMEMRKPRQSREPREPRAIRNERRDMERRADDHIDAPLHGWLGDALKELYPDATHMIFPVNEKRGLVRRLRPDPRGAGG